MRRIALLPLLAALFALPSPAVAGQLGPNAVRLPDVAQLERTARSGDELELARLGARFGAVRLLRIAVRGKSSERQAALKALALVDGAPELLPEAALLAADPDDAVGLLAAESARRLAERLAQTKSSPVDEELPRDVPLRAARTLAELAARTALKAERRALLLDALAALRPLVSVDEKLLFSLLSSDGEVRVRRAAAEALYGVGPADGALGAAVERDASLEVAAAAGASLCRDVGSADPKTSKGASKNAALEARAEELAPVRQLRLAAEARALKLSPGARARLRSLAANEQVTLADRLDLLGCLRAFAEPADRTLLDDLAKRGPDALKRRARALLPVK